MSSQIPDTGAVKFSDLRTVFNSGGTGEIRFSKFYADNASGYTTGVTGIPNTGALIKVSHFRGKQKGGNGLYAFSSHTFTNCGQTSYTGPTLSQCTSTYSAQTWAQNTSYFNMTTQGYQRWTVPATGSYTITVAGAAAGGVGTYGRGIIIQSTLTLTQSQVINIVVGQMGTIYTSSSGGGGSFVWVDGQTTPLIVAGGGGGLYSGTWTSVSDATSSTSGRNNWVGASAGGTGGYGGQAGLSGSPYGGGGGGWYGDGGTAQYCADTYGRSILYSGGTGGRTCASCPGGFGGGGGTHGNSGGGAGGGGYSGGAGDGHNTGSSAGGGGSYYTTGGATGSYNASHGYVTITANFTISTGPGLYTFSNHTFTNASATGRFGPTLSACRSAYSSTSWASTYLNMNTQGIQLWTVPTSGTYKIECVGASGAYYGSATYGGRGARMIGTFSFTQGQVISIVVGQQATQTSYPAGGGGSFVYLDSSTPYIIAGGGAGVSANFSSDADGQSGQSAGSARDSAGYYNTTYTGVYGQAVGVGHGSWLYSGRQQCSGGGTGWLSVGAESGSGAGGYVKSASVCGDGGSGGQYVSSGSPFIGGLGSCNSLGNHAGFGGGGGGGCGGEGGGGGYTGGGGTWSTQSHGGGAGSYNNGTNQSNTTGYNTGHGYVTITLISSGSSGWSSSTILTSARHSSAISTLLPNKTFTLLFRASRDGYTSSAFHTKCNGNAGIWVVVKASTGYIATAYSSVAFNSIDNYVSATSGTCWLNNLDNGSTVSSSQWYNTINPQYSLYDGSTYGPTFGNGHDLYIPNNCNTNTGYTYTPYGYNVGGGGSSSGNQQTLLFGNYSSWTVTDYEVYKIT